MRRLFALATTALSLSFALSAFAGDAEKGKAVFEGAKPACKACHNDTKNPLSKVGAQYSAEEIKAWIRTPKEMFAKKDKKGMMPAYSAEKISDADLDNLAAYLASMK